MSWCGRNVEVYPLLSYLTQGAKRRPSAPPQASAMGSCAPVPLFQHHVWSEGDIGSAKRHRGVGMA